MPTHGMCSFLCQLREAGEGLCQQGTNVCGTGWVTVTHQGRGRLSFHREPTLSPLGVACPAGATLPQGPPTPQAHDQHCLAAGPSVGPLGGDSWTALGSCSCFTHMTTQLISTFWAVRINSTNTVKPALSEFLYRLAVTTNKTSTCPLLTTRSEESAALPI